MEYTFTTPWNWQADSYANYPTKTKCSPTLVELNAWLLATFGGQDLGCYGQRNIRGGGSPSSHGFGAGRDWRYSNVGSGRTEVGRAKAVEVMEFVIANAKRLGVQQIHDYFGDRIWKIGRGWRFADGPAFGEKWALYVHFEVHNEAWADTRPILARLADVYPNPVVPIPVAPDPNPIVPPIEPTAPQGAPVPTMPVTIPTLEVLRLGVPNSRDVLRLQALLIHMAGQPITADGNFGPQTDTAVRNFQAFFKIAVDGVVGPQTWRTLIDA